MRGENFLRPSPIPYGLRDREGEEEG